MGGIRFTAVTALTCALAFAFGDKAGIAWEASGADIMTLDGLEAAGEVPLLLARGLVSEPLRLDLAGLPLYLGLALAACALIGSLYLLADSRVSKRRGEEHGSARWAAPRDIAPFRSYRNPDPYNATILTERFGMALSRSSFSLRYDRNLNTLVVGGSGCGKTRYYVKPNLCQLNANFVVTDPKGQTVRKCGWMLAEAGYDVRVFDTSIPSRSLRYNPIAYLETDVQILSFANSFFSMTAETNKTGGDQFFDDAAKNLLIACIALLRDYYPPWRRDIGSVLSLLNLIRINEEDEGAQDAFDLIFDQIRTGKKVKALPAAPDKPDGYARAYAKARQRTVRVDSPLVNYRTGRRPAECGGFKPEEDYALENYLSFKSGAGKTVKSILITLTTRLQALRTGEVRGIVTGGDQMRLDDLGRPDKKTAIFCVFDDGDQKTLGFLHGLLVWQAINRAKQTADRDFEGRLPRPVRFILDEYYSLHLPPEIADMISIVRSRNISMDIILQSMAQLTARYDESVADSIVDCCSTTLYLGGKSEKTQKAVSEAIGQQTVQQKTSSVSHGGGGSWSESTQTLARALIDTAEVGKLDGRNAILMVSGTDAIVDKKFLLEGHANYARIDPGHRPRWRLRAPVARWRRGALDGDATPPPASLPLAGERLLVQAPLVRERPRHDGPFDAARAAREREEARREQARARVREIMSKGGGGAVAEKT